MATTLPARSLVDVNLYQNTNINNTALTPPPIGKPWATMDIPVGCPNRNGEKPGFPIMGIRKFDDDNNDDDDDYDDIIIFC